LKEIIESNYGELPDFKFVYLDEDEFSFSRQNIKTEDAIDLYSPEENSKRSGPLSVYDLMDDFCSISHLEVKSQAK
jgi:hypothetical protein